MHYTQYWTKLHFSFSVGLGFLGSMLLLLKLLLLFFKSVILQFGVFLFFGK